MKNGGYLQAKLLEILTAANACLSLYCVLSDMQTPVESVKHHYQNTGQKLDDLEVNKATVPQFLLFSYLIPLSLCVSVNDYCTVYFSEHKNRLLLL